MNSRREEIIARFNEAMRAHYGPLLAAGRQGHQVVDWASRRSQLARFAVLADNVDLEGASLLDAGCGVGELWAYLKDRNIRCDYLGVDLMQQMTERAGRLHPDGRFQCADILTQDPFGGRRFDVVFCSGMFNLTFGHNMEFLPMALGRLWEFAGRTLVFNLLHHRAGGAGKRYFYYDPAQVLPLLEPLGCRCRLLDDYLPNDFTVICTRPPAAPPPGN